MKLNIGVFSWNVNELIAAVTAFEKQGHFVTGYEVRKLQGYGACVHDKLIFLEYAPDVLDAWKAKGDIGSPEIVMPNAPRKFGDPVPVSARSEPTGVESANAANQMPDVFRKRRAKSE